MDSVDIFGIRVRKLSQLSDQRGRVMHMVRADAPDFPGFGEIYFSTVNHNQVKAWKFHELMVQNFAVPVGRILLVCFDPRKESPTLGKFFIKELAETERDYYLVQIPPRVWYGFKGLATPYSLLANCASIPHDPAESKKLDWNSQEIPFHWD